MAEPFERRTAPEATLHSAENSWEAEWEDWWRTDRIDAVGWAALFLWGALVVVAHNTSFQSSFDWWNGWGVYWIGAGVILLVETVVRSAMPRYRPKWGWTLFWGAAFLSFGMGDLASPAWYALPLAAIAAVILSGAFAHNA